MRSPKVQIFKNISKMIRYLFGLISLALFLTACDAGVMPAEVSFDAGSIFLEPTSENGWNVEHVFTIRNATADEINFGETVVSCGCARCDLSTKSLKPGESVDVSVGVNLRYMRERRREYATVNWSRNGQANGDVQAIRFVIECEVFPRVIPALSMRELKIDFNDQQPDAIKVDFIAYCPQECEKSLELEIIGLDSSMRGFEISQTNRTELASGIDRLEKSLTISPKTFEKQNTIGDFKVLASSGNAELLFPVEFGRRDAIDVRPKSLFLSTKNRKAKIRLESQNDLGRPVLEFDQKVLKVIREEKLDERAYEFEFAVVTEKVENSFECDITFVFQSQPPLKYKVYVLK
jgi:Protein of unknown function (DUF1573)